MLDSKNDEKLIEATLNKIIPVILANYYLMILYLRCDWYFLVISFKFIKTKLETTKIL